MKWLEAYRPSEKVIRRMRHTLYGMSVIAVISTCVAPFYSLAINFDHSLPEHVFVIHKGEEVHKGDFVAFEFQGYEPWFPKGTVFVKLLSGIEGDRVYAINRDGCVEYHVNHTTIGCAKPRTHDGHPLKSGPVGKVPPHRLVVRGTSPDSFDSRYAGVGWIDEQQVMGRAYAIF